VHVGYGGAAGGGKSYLARSVVTLAALLWKGSTSIIFRRTRPEIRENHIVKFLQEVPDGDGEVFKFKQQESVAEWFNGSRTLFGYLERDDDVYRYHGAEYDLMIFEEATHYSWFQVSWLTGNRLRATVDGARPFAMYPSNPGNRGHFWYKRLFIDRNFHTVLNERAEDYAFVPAKVTDNEVLMMRDPQYMQKLNQLPEPLRSQLRDGDWTAGTGLALSDLRYEKHVIKPFEIPAHWHRFNSFDWGFNHPFVFGHFTADEDGNVYLIESVLGRHLKPWEQIERIQDCEAIDWDSVKYSVAGHDIWADHKARGENVPTIAEQFSSEGIHFRQANISRIAGLNNMRKYLDWSQTGEPRFFIFDTEANRKVFGCLESMVVDPDNMEDALKTDADDFGEGGDDAYDMVRYGLASRPLDAPEAPEEPLPTEGYDHHYEERIRELQPRTGRRGFY
jgi:phage terminase large subunit